MTDITNWVAPVISVATSTIISYTNVMCFVHCRVWNVSYV